MWCRNLSNMGAGHNPERHLSWDNGRPSYGLVCLKYLKGQSMLLYAARDFWLILTCQSATFAVLQPLVMIKQLQCLGVGAKMMQPWAFRAADQLFPQTFADIVWLHQHHASLDCKPFCEQCLMHRDGKSRCTRLQSAGFEIVFESLNMTKSSPQLTAGLWDISRFIKGKGEERIPAALSVLTFCFGCLYNPIGGYSTVVVNLPNRWWIWRKHKQPCINMSVGWRGWCSFCRRVVWTASLLRWFQTLLQRNVADIEFSFLIHDFIKIAKDYDILCQTMVKRKKTLETDWK